MAVVFCSDNGFYRNVVKRGSECGIRRNVGIEFVETFPRESLYKCAHSFILWASCAIYKVLL